MRKTHGTDDRSCSFVVMLSGAKKTSTVGCVSGKIKIGLITNQH